MKEDLKLKKKTCQQHTQLQEKRALWYRKLPIAHAAYGEIGRASCRERVFGLV